ncbi:hypothetical protein pipiens_004667 [Culex pipiens pipiens]|uniref:Uncharacterized protein n=1 Tax=Culex pipiens pipiens TaxID=38569 RepID=A0ABD1CGN2_CULPP
MTTNPWPLPVTSFYKSFTRHWSWNTRIMLPILFTGLPRPSVLMLQLVQRNPAVVAQDLAANVLADWRRAVQLLQHVRYDILALQVKQRISYLSGSDMKKMPHRPMSLAL